MTDEKDKNSTQELTTIHEQDPPDVTAEEWRMFTAFKESAEKRLSDLMSKDEIRQMVFDVMEEVLGDRPNSEKVVEMIREMHTAEARRIDFVLTAAIESVKMYGDTWSKQNEEYAARLARETARDKQTMQDVFSREVAEMRRVVNTGLDEAKAAVNQHSGRVEFLQTIVQQFNERTNELAERQDNQADRIAQVSAQQNDAETRFTQWMIPFQGESGFIALVKKQSKVIDQQQRGAEMRQALWRAGLAVVKRPEFWALFGAGGTSAGIAILKFLGAF